MCQRVSSLCIRFLCPRLRQHLNVCPRAPELCVRPPSYRFTCHVNNSGLWSRFLWVCTIVSCQLGDLYHVLSLYVYDGNKSVTVFHRHMHITEYVGPDELFCLLSSCRVTYIQELLHVCVSEASWSPVMMIMVSSGDYWEQQQTDSHTLFYFLKDISDKRLEVSRMTAVFQA